MSTLREGCGSVSMYRFHTDAPLALYLSTEVPLVEQMFPEWSCNPVAQV